MQSDISDEIMAIVRGVIDIDVEPDTDLIENGVMDSVYVMEIVADIENQYGIEIDGDDIDPANFATVSDIVRLTLKYIAL